MDSEDSIDLIQSNQKHEELKYKAFIIAEIKKVKEKLSLNFAWNNSNENFSQYRNLIANRTIKIILQF